VGFHLYRAFPKLGVTTREELARYAPWPNRPPERPGGSGHRGRSGRRVARLRCCVTAPDLADRRAVPDPTRQRGQACRVGDRRL